MVMKVCESDLVWYHHGRIFFEGSFLGEDKQYKMFTGWLPSSKVELQVYIL
jgi:hypothetical protein